MTILDPDGAADAVEVEAVGRHGGLTVAVGAVAQHVERPWIDRRRDRRLGVRHLGVRGVGVHRRRHQRHFAEIVELAEQGRGKAHRRVHADVALRRQRQRRIEAVDDVFAHDRKSERGQVDAVEIEQILVLQRRIADAGQRTGAGIGDAVARRVRLDQAAEQRDVDQFDADAGARDRGQRRLHLGIVVQAIGGADRCGGIAGRFRQLADVAGRENERARTCADQRIDAVQRLGGAVRGGRLNTCQGSAGLIILPGIVAADADFHQIGSGNLLARGNEALPLLGEAGNARTDRVGGLGLGAADGEIVLRNSQQRRRGIDEIGAAAEPAGRIFRRVRRAEDLEEVSGIRVAVAEGLDGREDRLRGGLVAKWKERRACNDRCA